MLENQYGSFSNADNLVEGSGRTSEPRSEERAHNVMLPGFSPACRTVIVSRPPSEPLFPAGFVLEAKVWKCQNVQVRTSRICEHCRAGCHKRSGETFLKAEKTTVGKPIVFRNCKGNFSEYYMPS